MDDLFGYCSTLKKLSGLFSGVVLFRRGKLFGSISVTIFSILLALGSVLALLWVSLDAPGKEMRIRVNAAVGALGGALIGARIAYVSMSWEYFQEHVAEIFQLWLGGLSWPGALAGALLAVGIIALLRGIPLSRLMDNLLPIPAILAVTTWLGCWLTGCGYGPVADFGLPSQDEWGIWQRRIPVQLIAAILTVILFWGIEAYRRQRKGLTTGLAACLGLGGLSLVLLLASFLRVDAYPQYHAIRLETWAALTFLGISILAGILVTIRKRD